MIKNLTGKWGIEFGAKTLTPSSPRTRNFIAGGYIGHSYKVKIGLKADSLKNGMVTDFKHLNFVKSLIDEHFDHKFMIDRNDPLFDAIFDEFREIQQVNKHAISDYFGFFEWVDISKLKYPNYAPEILEHIESFVVVNFVPTSENICKFLFEIIDMKMGEFLASEGIELEFVELWETPKSHCIYRPQEV